MIIANSLDFSLNQKDIEKFYGNVDPLDMLSEIWCWHWLLKKDKNGYGKFHIKGRGGIKAHRLSYLLHKGPIPQGMLVCHSCDNPACVNPSHLWLGTPLSNMLDKMYKGRCSNGFQPKRTHCAHGHEFTGENTKYSSKGKKRCATCARKRSLEEYYKTRDKALVRMRNYYHDRKASK